MKKIIPLSMSFVALGLAAFAGLSNSKINKASAYPKTALATTINLNDNTDAEIRNYYSNLNSLSDAEKQGTNLLKNLKPILMNGQKYYSYDKNNGKEIWQMYEITDRDWDKSPASEITGYNSSTNTITGYTYGESASKPGSNPYIHALYVNRDADNKVRAWQVEGDTKTSHGGNNQWCIDREHIWPKSHGFDNDDDATYGARGDPMHLWAGDSYVNSALHSNYFYGYVDTDRAFTDGKDKYSYDKGNLMGYSKTVGGDKYVFEPQDSDKGDIARAVFYMVARYNNIAGNDSTIDVDNPNLTLASNLDENSATGTSTASQAFSLGLIQDLLEWNELDPVDEFEIHRNNLLYNNYTNNRNPFIDFPQWANVIWGTASESANPTTDVINDAAIKVEEVNPITGTFDVGATRTLKATSIDNSPITWSVENSEIVSLDKTSTNSGESVVVTALKNGKTKVIAKATIDGKERTKSFQITVGKDNPQDSKEGFDFKAFFEANKIWFIILGIGLLVLIIVIVVLFIKFGSKKSKKKVTKAVKKTVKKTVKNSGKSSSNSKKK